MYSIKLDMGSFVGGVVQLKNAPKESDTDGQQEYRLVFVDLSGDSPDVTIGQPPDHTTFLTEARKHTLTVGVGKNDVRTLSSQLQSDVLQVRLTSGLHDDVSNLYVHEREEKKKKKCTQFRDALRTVTYDTIPAITV